MSLRLGQSREVTELAPARTVLRQGSIVLPSPCAAFPGQDPSPLLRGMSDASLQVNSGAVVVPPLQLELYTIANGAFFVGHGLDGAILDGENRPIHQTGVFCPAAAAGTALDLPAAHQLDEVFVGFDGAWRNYFHWLCFGVAKSFLAARHLPQTAMIAVPDYAGGLRDGAISYGEATWRQSLAFSGLSERVTALPSGVYRARKLHFFWTRPGQPTDIMYLNAFKDVFDVMAKNAGPPARALQSLYLARSKSVANRLPDSLEELTVRVLARHGFEAVGFEGMDLRQQITTFANTRRVVAAHGAGLVNTLFHRGGLRVLELNSRVDGDQAFRPWFYVTSAVRNHRYVSLDIAMPGFGEEHLEAAISALET